MHRARETREALTNKMLTQSSLWVVTEPEHVPFKELCVGANPFRLVAEQTQDSPRSSLPTPPAEPRGGDSTFRSRLVRDAGEASRPADKMPGSDADFELALDVVLATHDMEAVLSFASDVGSPPRNAAMTPGKSPVSSRRFSEAPSSSRRFSEVHCSSDESGDESDDDKAQPGMDEPLKEDRMEVKTPGDVPPELEIPVFQRLEMEESDRAMKSLAEETEEVFPLKRTLRSHWYTDPSTWRVSEPLHVLLNSPRRDAVLHGARKGELQMAEGGVLPMGREKLDICPDELDSDDIHGIMLEKQVIETDIAKSFKAHLEASNAHVPHFLKMCRPELEQSESSVSTGRTPRLSPRKQPGIETPRFPSISQSKTPRLGMNQTPRTLKQSPRARNVAAC